MEGPRSAPPSRRLAFHFGVEIVAVPLTYPPDAHAVLWNTTACATIVDTRSPAFGFTLGIV